MHHRIEQLHAIKDRFSDEMFLSNKGLSNEVGIHVFCYDPKDEMIVRRYFSDLIHSAGQPYRLIECDLYKIFLQIMRSHNILDNIQHLFSDIPVVKLYLGAYDGQTLSLFDEFHAGNYYRAFNMI